MAKVVERMPVRSETELYPWDQWLDGQAWQLTKGEDFAVTVHTITSYAYQAAKARGGNARVSVRGNDVYVKFWS